MEIYIESKVNGDCVDVNLLVHLLRNHMWERKERLVRGMLENKLERIRFGDSVDRQTLECVSKDMPYHHYIAYHGRMEYENLQGVIKSIKGFNIPIYDQMPANIGFKLPF